MNKRTLVEKLKALAASPSCCPELKQAVNNYLVALANEQVAAKNLVAELEDDVVDIDTLVKNVSDTEHMIKFFGVEGAKIFAENAYKLKASGAKYCNCFACQVGLEILDNRDVLLS
ncbi:MAG: heat-shock protein Hsp90 [Selenomonadaceae bacterium]|nr:heat-shock protein Hsp90 [Selenomonadaceae bacterium]